MQNNVNNTEIFITNIQIKYSMAVYLHIGDVFDLHELETNGKDEEYAAINPPGTSITYAGMPNLQTFSFIYTRPYEKSRINGNLFFTLEPNQKSKEITIGNIRQEISEITPDKILLQFLEMIENKK